MSIATDARPGGYSHPGGEAGTDSAGAPVRRRRRVGTVVAITALVGSFVAVPVAIGQTGDAAAVAGSWAGTSYDITYDIPGELTGSFTQQSPSTFTGTIYAVYPPELNPPETCTISSGQVFSTGAVRMSAQCHAEGYPYVDAAVIVGQLDESGTVMSGTFHGAFNDSGTFTLTKSGS